MTRNGVALPCNRTTCTYPPDRPSGLPTDRRVRRKNTVGPMATALCYCCYFCCRRRCFCRRRRRYRRRRPRRLLHRRGAGNHQVAVAVAAAVDTDQQRSSLSWSSPPTNPTRRLWNRISVRNNRPPGCCIQRTWLPSSRYNCPRPQATSADTALASNPLGPSVQQRRFTYYTMC